MALTPVPLIPKVQGRERAAGPGEGRAWGGALSGTERACEPQSRERQSRSSSLQPLPTEVGAAMDPLSVRDPCFPPLLIPVPRGMQGQPAAVGGRAPGFLIQGLEEKSRELDLVEQDATVPRRGDALQGRRQSESIRWRESTLRSY